MAEACSSNFAATGLARHDVKFIHTKYLLCGFSPRGTHGSKSRNNPYVNYHISPDNKSTLVKGILSVKNRQPKLFRFAGPKS